MSNLKPDLKLLSPPIIIIIIRDFVILLYKALLSISIDLFPSSFNGVACIRWYNNFLQLLFHNEAKNEGEKKRQKGRTCNPQCNGSRFSGYVIHLPWCVFTRTCLSMTLLLCIYYHPGTVLYCLIYFLFVKRVDVC
jgi:hypothetical protein